MNYKAIIPNGLTSLNLVFGVCSLLSTQEGHLSCAAWCVLLALVADGLDGRAARFFGVSSEIGKEMDSLCDLVSFGVAPAFLAYVYCVRAYGWAGAVTAICFALGAAWRLARFNVSTTVVHGYFMGLASPTAGCLVATSTLFMLGNGIDPVGLGWPYPVLMLALALMMVSGIHYPDFKGKGEPVSAAAKAAAAAVLAAIVASGLRAPVAAILFGLFAAYTALGLAGSALAALRR